MIVAIVDYGAGNLASVRRALAVCGATPVLASSPDALDTAEAIVVPGVGHFQATRPLDDRWRHALHARLAASVPLLGICLGMQWLFEGSEEAPELRGLGLFPGRCFRLSGDVKVPHVGWNSVEPARPSRLLAGLGRDACAYFTHSFAAPTVEWATAITTHGVPFASAVERGVVFGAQFHPEKSGPIGLRLLGNFLDVARKRAGAC